MIEAHERMDVRPSIRAVYDHFSAAVIVTPPDAWADRWPERTTTIYTAEAV
jgi:hypothetical protein